MKCIKNTLLFVLVLFLCAVICSACNSTAVVDNKAENIEADTKTTDIIETTKSQLESNGWEYIDTAKGHLDYTEWSSLWGNAIIEPDEEEKDKVLYTMVGRYTDEPDHKLYAIVKILAPEQKERGEVYKIIYISESGRIMDSENDKILSPKDSMLQDYMYSY